MSPLSEHLWYGIESIRADKKTQPGTLSKRLKMTDDDIKQLVRLGHLSRDGNMFKRTQKSVDAFQLFGMIPSDGSIAVLTLAEQSGLAPKRLESGLRLLVASAEIKRSGRPLDRVRLHSDFRKYPRARPAEKEADLYDSFVSWLQDSGSRFGVAETDTAFDSDGGSDTEERPPGELVFSGHIVTATGAGANLATGEWARPDAVSILAVNHVFTSLPSRTEVILRSFEIKPMQHAGRLQGVYEASAHQRLAHFAYLVVELPDHLDVETAVRDECLRLGVGLLRTWHGKVGFVQPAVRQSPKLHVLDEAVTRFLAASPDPGIRDNYLAATRSEAGTKRGQSKHR